MRKFNKDESVEIVNRINKIQRAEFIFKKENGREQNIEELSNLLNISIETIDEIKKIIIELEKEDEKLTNKSIHHSVEEIKSLRDKRKNKKEIKKIQDYMKYNENGDA